MRYRIKIVTYQNGRKAYFAQVKTFFKWVGIESNGEAHWAYEGECDERERALARIDKHYAGNTRVQRIEFEYVQK